MEGQGRRIFFLIGPPNFIQKNDFIYFCFKTDLLLIISYFSFSFASLPWRDGTLLLGGRGDWCAGQILWQNSKWFSSFAIWSDICGAFALNRWFRLFCLQETFAFKRVMRNNFFLIVLNERVINITCCHWFWSWARNKSNFTQNNHGNYSIKTIASLKIILMFNLENSILYTAKQI